jgi:ribose-phosphate pyrophosphokinase
LRGNPIIFAGTANPELAAAIAHELGIACGDCEVERFPDGELTVRLLQSVRDRVVYLVQPTSPPVNDHLIELLAFADACRRAAAGRVVAVAPYFGYARADKRVGRREPITAGMVAALFEAAGVDHLLTVDLHTPQIEGFFSIPVDTLSAVPVLCGALAGELPENAAVVSPDAGRVRLATEYAHRLDVPLIVLHKERTGGSSTRVTHVVGDVTDRACIVIDDMISTGGTLVETLSALRDAGAQAEFRAVATHALLLGDATTRLAAAGVRDLYVTDTIQITQRSPSLHVISTAPLLAGAIRQYTGEALR